MYYLYAGIITRGSQIMAFEICIFDSMLPHFQSILCFMCVSASNSDIFLFPLQRFLGKKENITLLYQLDENHINE